MNVIITGATGMVGQSVLNECLENDMVSKVLLITRSKTNVNNAKVKELIVQSFPDVSLHTDTFKEYDACFHCMGISAVGLTEEAYALVTFEYSKALYDTLYLANPNMVVTYVSGAGTDSTENGTIMWARVKGKTENYMLHRGFKDAYAFRPGIILPEKGVKSKTGWYNAAYVVLRPFFPLIKLLKSTTSSSEIGKAMLVVCKQPQNQKIIGPEKMNGLAELI